MQQRNTRGRTYRQNSFKTCSGNSKPPNRDNLSSGGNSYNNSRRSRRLNRCSRSSNQGSPCNHSSLTIRRPPRLLPQ